MFNFLKSSTNFEISLGFEDVAIRQKKNICKSRSEVVTASEVIAGIFRRIPMIAANMSTVCNADFCILLHKLGALGVLHRAFPNEQDLLDETQKIASQVSTVAVSIGIGEKQEELAKKLIANGANVIFIDVAHGYSDFVIDTAKNIKKYSPSVKVVIGNTTNLDIVKECHKYVDGIKVGIAQGFACETKNTAGCTEKQFSAVYKFKKVYDRYGIPIISDGGIREPADLVKAIGAGANSVMAGKIFAACPESAAETENVDGVLYKVYAGMASRYVQNKWKGELRNSCPEGGIRKLEMGEPVKELLDRYLGGLRSGITYAGGNSMYTFQKSVEFLQIRP